MSRLAIPSRDTAPAESRPLLDAVFKKFGTIPNLFRLAALSPNSLAGLLSLNQANSKSLDVKTRSRIAITVAQVNGCDYCLSAHTYIGTNLAKISAEDAALNRKGASTDAKASAADIRNQWHVKEKTLMPPFDVEASSVPRTPSACTRPFEVLRVAEPSRLSTSIPPFEVWTSRLPFMAEA